jgi:uncharacterized protein (DUF2252 family)
MPSPSRRAPASSRSDEEAAPDPDLDLLRAPVAERHAAGKALREKCPRRSHAGWKRPTDRRDALEMVLEAEKGRMANLLPLRHGRMVRSPFTFYRGAAATMAADLASTPTTGHRVQCCGDAHLSNFGGFATPERRVIFSINDLDETLPGPWEWDLKRLAASFAIASRDDGLKDAAAKDVVLTCVQAYRESMAEFSELKTLELWYYSLVADELVTQIEDAGSRSRARKRLQKERAKSTGEDIFPMLADQEKGALLIRDQPPTIFHRFEGHPVDDLRTEVEDAIGGWRATLQMAHQSLLDRYELRDAAIKVVGIGSVGTACWVLLFTAGDGDPLFIQVKEARASVLEPYAGASGFDNHGLRVVAGYRRMQPASDMFLGWSQGPRRDYFFRQLRDMKIGIHVGTFGPKEMHLYADWCGRALALAHARSGSSAVIAGYMGKNDAFDVAIADFSMAYADQNEKDHAAFESAVRNGKVKAELEPTP